MNRYEMDYVVDFRDVDRYYDLKAESILQILGTVSTYHEIKGLNLAPDYMRQRGLAWILYQWKYEITNPKQYARKIRLITMLESYKGIYCYRYYNIVTENGQTIGKAMAHWVVIDINKKRLTKMPKDLIEIIDGKNEINEEFNNLKESIKEDAPRFKLDDYDFSTEFNVFYSDIDVNNHVNNTVYAKWLIEAVNEWNNEFLSNNYASTINMVYKKEKPINGFVKIKLKNQDNETCFEILDEEDNVLNLAKITWGKRDRSLGDYSNY